MTINGFVSLPREHWLPLDHVLTWIAYGRPFAVPEPVGAEPFLLLDDDPLIAELQSAWRDLSNEALEGSIQVRGRRHFTRRDMREDYFHELAVDDFANCSYLARIGMLENGVRRFALIVSRYRQDYDGWFDSLDASNGSDFSDVFVRARDFEGYQVCLNKGRRRHVAAVGARKLAERWLIASIEAGTGHDLRKGPSLQYMRDRFGLTRDTALQVWRDVRAAHNVLGRPGRPRKPIEAAVP